ncbi:MAG TPA: aminomethyltransferase family protein [Verrucomicrobiae bacterium]|nr:aminomethyltransferase family protein [Verrucomicrobiae bacterium]
MRKDPTVERSEFASYVGVPPYARGVTRFRKGLKHTAFYPVIGRQAKEFKLHNSYLKPDQITDPVDEYWTLRKIAGLWDVTGEEVIEIAGPDALAVMNELIPRDLFRAKDGQCLYAVMCYDYGGIVEDAVLIRFSPEKIWWVGGPGHSEQWIYAHSLGRRVTVTSFLDDKHVASLQGPKSREILQRVTDADLSRVPFYHSVEAMVCGVPTVISRTGFTAELGYDIYVDVPQAEQMFGDLWEESRRDGVKLCGSRALGLRRIEAAIINFGQDFDWQHTPFNVGLGWMVNANKGFFHGREVLTNPASREPEQRLAGLRLEGQEAAFIGDPVLVEGKPVGQVTSASISPSLEASIAIAMLDRRAATLGQRVAVRLGEKPVAGEVVPMPFFDPERKLSKV